MLPAYRTDAELYSIPKFSLEKDDIEDFASELKAFHGEYRECFPRSESRDNFLRYMVGQFSTLERKSIEPMALHIQGAKVRAMQRFSAPRGCTSDEGRSLGAALQEEAPNHLKLHW